MRIEDSRPENPFEKIAEKVVAHQTRRPSISETHPELIKILTAFERLALPIKYELIIKRVR